MLEKIGKKIKSNLKKKDPKKDEAKKPSGRLLSGVVVSDKMDKTVVVKVDRYKKHPKYEKRYRVSKRYKAHDEKNECKEGDKVVIRECPPISKDKKWTVAGRK